MLSHVVENVNHESGIDQLADAFLPSDLVPSACAWLLFLAQTLVRACYTFCQYSALLNGNTVHLCTTTATIDWPEIIEWPSMHWPHCETLALTSFSLQCPQPPK
jgi:hypothetical protein